MAILKHISTLLSKKAVYSQNITDFELIDTAQGTVLVAVSNKGAGLTSFMLNGADMPAVGKTREPELSYGTYYSAPKLEVIGGAGDSYRIAITGQQGSLQSSLMMTGDGKLQDFVPLFSASQMPGNVVAMNAFEIAGQDYVLTGTDGSMTLTLYRLADNLSLSRLGSAVPGVKAATDAEYTDIEVMRIGSRSYAYAASAQGNMLSVYEVGASGITSKDVIDKSNSIGISAPREVEAVTTDNGRFLIVTGGESDSLTVFRISSSGGLSLTDHVVDSAFTRFEAATAIATVEMEGRVYIFVGGADDGISIFTLDGQGRLILLDVLVDTDAMMLADVSAIEAKEIGGKIAIFVASATETGITQLSYDPGNIGTSLVGSGAVKGTAADDILVGTGTSSALSGGAGDDILIARSGVVNMRGGTGRDTFVPGYGTKLVTILDFDPAQDRLDLSELAYIRSVAQLQILPAATGALLVAGEVRIEIRTTSGAPMRASDFKDAMFKLAHYANDIDYSKLVTAVTPDPGEPSTTKPPTTGNPSTGTSGGYVGPAALPAVAAFATTVQGTNGADRLANPATGGQINGFAGDDQLTGASAGRNNLTGGTGKDTLTGGTLSDYLDGGEDNDSIIGGGGHDRLSGGTGSDFIAGGAGDDRINGGHGRNILIGNDGNDVIIATGNGGNIMRGDNGSDLIQGVGADTIIGGAGHDRLFSNGNNNRIAGNDGNDLIRVTGTSNVLVGGAGNDSIFGGVGRDYLYGGDGDDRLNGGGGNDFLIAHTGNDTMHGNAGNDHVIGMAGDDVILGGVGNDLLWGVEGNDYIRGETGNDSLRGGDGRDTLYGDAGDDRVLGGQGDDRLYGGSGADFMLAQEGDDTVDGGDGNDLLDGASGRDLLDGGNGNDLLKGGNDNDVLRGGAGNDVLNCGKGNDVASGGAGDDRIDGDAGRDVLDGGSGNDKMLGGTDNDLLRGSTGHDVLNGGSGNDTLTGGTGNDSLTGGLGEDVFIFTAPVGSAVEYDSITDFQPGQDMIDLSGVARSIVWMGTSRFTGDGRAEMRVQEYSNRTRLLIDTDGDGDSDLVIDVHGGTFSPFDLLF